MKVKNLLGQTSEVDVSDCKDGTDLQAKIDSALSGSFQLFFLGKQISSDTVFEPQKLEEDAFLVALPVKKRKQRPEAGNLGQDTTKPSHEHNPGRARPKQSAQNTEPIRQEDSILKLAQNQKEQSKGSPIPGTPKKQRQNAQSLSPFAQMQSPPRDDSGMFSLLPGYNSRPNPSPEKARKRQKVRDPEGGFVTNQSDLAPKSNPNVLTRSARLSSERTSMTSSLPSQPSSSQSDFQTNNLQSGNLTAFGSEMELFSQPSMHKKAQTDSSERNRGNPKAQNVMEIGLEQSETALLQKKASARSQFDRKPDSKGNKAKEDELWAELARELHASEERRNNPPKLPDLPSLAKIDLKSGKQGKKTQKDDLTPKGKEKQRLERIDLKARNALLAHTDRNHPIASSPDKSKSKPQEINNDGLPETPNEDPQGDPPKPKKGRSKERIFLPGGHDMRLTAQGKLSSKEAANVGKLPLPSQLSRLERIFNALNTVHSFLQMRDIQASWLVMQDAVKNFPGVEDAELEDIEKMVKLCPDVVYLHDTSREDGPRSIVEFNEKLQSLNHALQHHSPRKSPNSSPQHPGIKIEPTDDPLSVHSDVAEIISHRLKHSLILEITDISRHSVGMIARAMSSKNTKDSLQSMDSGTLAKLGKKALAQKASSEKIDDAKEEEKGQQIRDKEGAQEDLSGISETENSAEEDKGPQEKGRKAAISRKKGAFRRGLVRSVMLLHDAYLAKQKEKLLNPIPLTESEEEVPENLGILETQPVSRKKGKKGKKTSKKTQEKEALHPDKFDPLKEGTWFLGFHIEDLKTEDLLEASIKAAQDYEQAQQNGRLRHFREDFVGSTNAPRPPRMTRKTEPCRDCSQMGVLEFLEHLKDLQWYNGQVVHIEDMPPRIGIFLDTDKELSPATWRALKARGISQLFSHQAQAINYALSGRHVVVSTSTASGKSLCYNIPVIEALSEDRGSTAIYIFPTKALAQDQMRALRSLLSGAFPEETPIADVYDGDTAKEDRAEIRSRAQMMITNPDMLHQSILPFHGQFATLLSKLKYVVVDEGHAYRGAFGCHTALVIRRLRRICSRVYKTFPTFVVTSATIANPQELVKSLLGVQDVTLIDQDGSPHGPQRYVLWNPPLTHFNEALKAANPDSSIGQMSRTEGRARKGERKRHNRRAVIKAVEEGDFGGGVKDDENPNHTLAMSVARMHRLRHSIGHPQELGQSEKDDSGFQNDSDDAILDLGLDDYDPEQLAVQQGNGEDSDFKERSVSQNETPSLIDLRNMRESNQSHKESTAECPQTSEPAMPKRRGRGRQLSKEAIQAAMISSIPKRPEENDKRGEDASKSALAAVSSIVLAPKEKLRFEPKDITYRSDEPGSNGPNRLVLRRKLHGERFGQKSGMKHPMGQYSHSTSDINTRMPGAEWREGREGKASKGKYGTAGVSLDKRRRSPIVEISTLLVECVQHGLRTIAFCKTRKLCELVITYTREMLRQSAPHLSHAISVYRAGYNPTERREIEKALFNGDILAVAATNALELGLDVGSLDLTMHLGFQGSIASFRQQAGRAGRREQQSMSIYVAFDGPLDQYFMTYPRNLFDKPIEGAHVDPENAMLMEQHLVCASAETPILAIEDQHIFGPKIHQALNTLTSEGFLGRHPMSTARVNALHYIGRHDNPASQFSLRAIDPERYQIFNEIDGKVIEEIEESKAFFQVYDGAVYMFQGRTYLCKKLDLQSKTAIVRPVDVKYYTSIREHQDIFVVGGSAVYPSPEAIIQQLRGDEEPTMAQCAEAEHTTRWLGFHRVRHGTGEIFDSVDLFLPDVQFPTQAAYLRVPAEAKANLAKEGMSEQWREGLHAAMHAMQNVVPLHMMCGPNDLGAECDNPYSARFRPDRLLLYDKCPGGIGLAYRVCDLFGVLMRKAVALIEACPCTSDTGCPGCVQHTGCNQYNAVLHKKAGIIVLNAVLEAQAKFREKLASRIEAGGDLKESGGMLRSIGDELNILRS